jgi:pimeloyl-ACP methyl ester carboxylesterase
MATYVLVHGAWSGAHTFRKVRPLLAGQGHEVFTPSLTGLGERAHLASPLVDLTTHVTDVVNAVSYEDLREIVLVGYSYGGCVVTGALAHVAERVRHLVYLDAFVPSDGESLYDLTGQQATAPLTQIGSEWLVPPLEREFDDPREAAWALPRRRPHPIGCFTEPVRLARPLEDYPFSRTYIKATDEPPDSGRSSFWQAAKRAQASPAWSYREINTGHMIPHNRPEELAALLLELA